MSLPQKIVLGIGVLVIAGMVLFPPWIFAYRYDPSFRPRGFNEQQEIQRPAGYHAIWESHVPSDPTALGQLFSITKTDEADRLNLRYFSMRLDKDRFWIQLVGALLLTLLLTALLKGKAI
jgi:hypothetical protein